MASVKNDAKIAIVVDDLRFLHSHRSEIVSASLEAGADVAIFAPDDPQSPGFLEAKHWFENQGAVLFHFSAKRYGINPISELLGFCLYLFYCSSFVQPFCMRLPLRPFCPLDWLLGFFQFPNGYLPSRDSAIFSPSRI